MDRQTAYLLRSHKVDVLLEDDSVLVLSKPAGLLVLPDRYDKSVPNLLRMLTAYDMPVWVVHRLDRDTSGVIVFARTAEVHADLNAQFEGREVEKHYVAICRGTPEKDEGLIDLPLGPHRHVEGRTVVDRKEGKDSVTNYRVSERFDGHVAVEAHPRTARTHQIRVHLAERGMPIVADPLYGDGKPFFLSRIKRGSREGLEPEKPLLARTALHVLSVTFRHPHTSVPCTVKAPLPKDLRSVLQALRKYAPSR
ncbi:MAG: RluA family pseudouridine synthase [Bacteroidota bacterium]